MAGQEGLEGGGAVLGGPEGVGSTLEGLEGGGTGQKGPQGRRCRTGGT